MTEMEQYWMVPALGKPLDSIPEMVAELQQNTPKANSAFLVFVTKFPLFDFAYVPGTIRNGTNYLSPYIILGPNYFDDNGALKSDFGHWISFPWLDGIFSFRFGTTNCTHFWCN